MKNVVGYLCMGGCIHSGSKSIKKPGFEFTVSTIIYCKTRVNFLPRDRRFFYTYRRKAIGMRRNLETDVVRNGKSRNRPPALPATYNTGKTDSYRGTTGTASAPGTRTNVSPLYCRKSVAGDGRFPLG